MTQRLEALAAVFVLVTTVTLPAGISAAAAAPSPIPQIRTLLKPNVQKRVLENREVMTAAKLEDVSGPIPPHNFPLKRYSFYVAMTTREGLKRTRAILTDYRIYAQLVPYMNKAEFDPKTHILQVEGGVWKYMLRASVHFDERSDEWIHWQIVEGHFKGLAGDIYFQTMPDGGTAVYMSGEIAGRGKWPPQVIVERGAEVVFGFTAQRMRSYIESGKSQEKPHEESLPQPRRRF